VRIVDGELEIAPADGPAYALVDSSDWGAPADYRIEFDARKTNSTAGTVQVAFRGETFADRYVLVLNGSAALLRRMDSAGNNVELTRTAYAFDQTARKILIDVAGSTVSVSANGTPLLSYTNKDDADRDAADWSGLQPGLALINMTAGAPVAFDNVKAVRVPAAVGVEVTVTDDGEADP